VTGHGPREGPAEGGPDGGEADEEEEFDEHVPSGQGDELAQDGLHHELDLIPEALHEEHIGHEARHLRRGPQVDEALVGQEDDGVGEEEDKHEEAGRPRPGAGPHARSAPGDGTGEDARKNEDTGEGHQPVAQGVGDDQGQEDEAQEGAQAGVGTGISPPAGDGVRVQRPRAVLARMGAKRVIP
jgi:hypothetical protein